MRILETAVLMTLALSLAAPAHAGLPEPLLKPEELKDHLWKFDDLERIAARLPERRLVTRRFSHNATKIYGGLSIGLINAPMDKVIPIVQDYGSFKDMLPFFKESTVLGSGGNRTLVHVKIEIAKGVVKLWGNLEFFVLKGKRGVRVIDGKMTEGNMKVFRARFELVPIQEKRTLILVRLIVDPDIQIAKDAKVNKYNQVNARRFIRAIRDRAEGIEK